MFRKIVYSLVFTLVFGVMLTGCDKQIFVNKEDKYKAVALEDDELKTDLFYVKDKSRFYEVYMPEGTVTGKSSMPKSDRVLWVDKDITLIPTYYSDEILAYTSKETGIKEIVIERFRDAGYSLGLYGGYIDEDGYLCYDLSENLIEDSDAEEVFSKDSYSESIRIVAINNVPVSEETIDASGVIVGLIEDEEYTIDYYSGTKYTTSKITADLNLLESYEIYNIDTFNTTKNGYLSIQMPEKCKSGYYMINGSGIFKYYSFVKGGNEEGVDLNEPYYNSIEEQIIENSQQYAVSIAKRTKHVLYEALFEADSIIGDNIHGVLQSPEGEVYSMTVEEGRIFIELEEAMAGNWKINIMPKDLQLTAVNVDATKTEREAQGETFTLFVTETMENAMFKANLSHKLAEDSDLNEYVWGTIEDENGKAVNMEVVDDSYLYASYPYLPAGTYTVTIYHYPEVTIEDVDYMEEGVEYEEIELF